MYRNLILNELNESKNVLNDFLKNDKNIYAIQIAACLLAEALKNKKKILSCGNGGSNCDAMHFASELTGRYREKRSGYPAIAISDISYISSVSNDFGYNYVFSRYISTFGSFGDILLAISTSGNSENIFHAMHIARKKNMKIIILTGNNGGKISGIADVEIFVPHVGFADRIQEMHIKIIHILICLIEKEMNK